MRYLKLWVSFLKISWMAEAEFRLNMVVSIVSDIIWYFSQISVFEVLFYNAPHIAGWDILSMRVFMAILFLIDACYMILFHDNFEQANSLVRKGELDFILSKPVNSQFMFSCRIVKIIYSINIVIVGIYLAWAIQRLPVQPPPFRYFVTLGLMVSGVAVLYSLRFFFAALNVVFTNATSLTYVWYQLYRLGHRPHALYPPWLRWIVLTIFPVAIIVSVPATNMVHGLERSIMFLAPVIAMTLLYLTTRYWRFVLHYYSSASS